MTITRSNSVRRIAKLLLVCALAAGAISCNASSKKDGNRPSTETPASEPRVTYAEGGVTVARAGRSAEEAPLSVGETLAAGDSVTTGKDGSCAFEVPGIGFFELGPDSRVTIDAHVFAARRGALSLQAGRIASKIERLGGKDSFILRTPSMVCGVRGTEFVTAIGPDGELSVQVESGSVSVFPEALLTHDLHPAAELLRPGTEAESTPAAWESPTAQAIVDALPTVGPGQSIVISAKAMSESLPEIERVATALSADTEASDATARASKLLNGIKEIVPEPTSKTEGKDRPGETARDGYAHSAEGIAEPTKGELGDDVWFRPLFVRAKPAERKSLAPMNANNATIVVNPNKKGAKGSFEGGRARLTVRTPEPVDWLAFVTPNTPVALAKGALYLAEFTAWTKKDAMRVTYNVSEGAKDRNGDGEAFSPFGYYFIDIDQTPQRYSFLYSHAENSDPEAQINVSVGSSSGEAYVQDISLTKLSDITPQGPEPRNALLPNGSFSRGFLFWEPLFWNNMPQGGITIEEGRMRYEPGTVPKERWHVQLGTIVPIRKGQRYAIAFDMFSASRGKIGVELFENGKDKNKDGNTLSPNAPFMIIEVAPGAWQRHTLRFTAVESDPRSRLCFSLGELPGTVYLDNVVLTAER